ncbi:MAG: nuclear transport factor 2 family protein [Acidimicrobiia bacterium]
MELWEIEARLELADLLSAYYRNGDANKLVDQANLFEPDGVVELYGRGTFTGRDAIVGAYTGLTSGHTAKSGVTHVRHFSSNYTLTFQSQTEASGEGYWLLLDDYGLAQWGRCRDRYRKGDDGVWRFTWRHVRRDQNLMPPVA